MAELFLPMDDLDVVGIGLAGSWSEPPRWLADALARAVAAQPGELLALSHQRNQIGLLESALRRLDLLEALPPAERARLDGELLAIGLVQDVLLGQLVKLDALFGMLGIRPTYLKGFACARYYERRCDRPFNDVDVLVPRADALTVYTALLELGFAQGRFNKRTGRFEPGDERPGLDDPAAYELPKLTRMLAVELVEPSLRRRLSSNRVARSGDSVLVPMPVEVHYALEADGRFPLETRDLGVADLPNGRDLVPEVQLAYLSYKAYTDIVLLGARAGLKIVADVVRFLALHAPSIAWSGLLERWHQRGLCAPLRYVLGAAADIYGCAVPMARLGGCACDRTADELGDVTAGSPLDVGDFLPFLARRRARFAFRPEPAF
ncbi:nucleotidyltransferase family protein [Azospirillum sp. ST 5-10]|uniref:nucleotidyltransferase family protein n=1 Tax=unclassified Azospirillum TaxID=2630922 RepID=UPI003F49FB54